MKKIRWNENAISTNYFQLSRTGENAQFDLINCRYSYLRKKRFLFLTVYYF